MYCWVGRCIKHDIRRYWVLGFALPLVHGLVCEVPCLCTLHSFALLLNRGRMGRSPPHREFGFGDPRQAGWPWRRWRRVRQRTQSCASPGRQGRRCGCGWSTCYCAVVDCAYRGLVDPVLKWIVAGAAKHIAPRLCIFQARAMNKLNRRCCRTSLRAVRARTRDAQAACTSCI